MLTDLRKKLEPVGRLDALDVVGQRALKYYAGQNPGSLDADALGRRSRALHLVGEVRNIRGDTSAALIAFRQAARDHRRTAGARSGQCPAHLRSRAERLLGRLCRFAYHGDQKGTEAGFREYKVLADRLVAIDPKNPEWLMERSYAENNLGTLFFEQSRYPEAATAFTNAVNVGERVVALKPGDSGLRIELGTQLNWLAQTRGKMGEMRAAIDINRRRDFALSQRSCKGSQEHHRRVQGSTCLATLVQSRTQVGPVGRSPGEYRYVDR